MKRYLILILLATTIISCKNKESNTETQPKISNIIESVYASVTVKPNNTYFPQPISPGIIDEIFVKEGDTVENRQILFHIKPSVKIKGQLSNAEIALEEAKSNYSGRNNLLNNIKLEIESLTKKTKLDSINFKRQESLLSQNIGKKIDFDQAKLQYQSTKNQLRILKQKLKQSKNTLENNYKKALNSIQTEKNQLADYMIRSKMNGRIYSINKEKGDFISAQEKFSEIGSIDKFKIEMNIDEVDITKVKLGDSVLILLDAYEDEVFVARINKIFPKKNDLTQTFRVESTFEKAPSKLYYGLSGEGNIIVSKRNNTLVIPTEYLLPNNKVITVDGEKSVKTGVKNLEFVEILSGIKPTTTIIKPNK